MFSIKEKDILFIKTDRKKKNGYLLTIFSRYEVETDISEGTESCEILGLIYEEKIIED